MCQHQRNYWLGLLPQMKPVASEIYAHPLASDAEEGNRKENPGGAVELLALLSPRVRKAIESAGFSLATYEKLSPREL